MRCAIYTTVSTDEQVTSEYGSLRRQEEGRRNYIDIQAEKGWKVAELYEDPGYSGKGFQRPGIQELLEDVRAGKLDAFVTYKIDCVSRCAPSAVTSFLLVTRRASTTAAAACTILIPESRLSLSTSAPEITAGAVVGKRTV